MSAKIIWLTGLSGSGKTTLSNAISRILKKKNYKVKIIDGDNFRKKSNATNKFSLKSIYENNISIIKFVKKIKNKYDFIILSVISPLLKTRKIAKKNFEKDYFEIFLDCKIKTLEKRDTKGLYIKAKQKKIKNLIGYNSNIKYQKSKYKKIYINTDKLNVKDSVKIILERIKL